jgi:hypothetical protein
LSRAASSLYTSPDKDVDGWNESGHDQRKD